MASTKYILLAAIFVLTAMHPVNALGIGPAKMLIDFRPNASQQYDFVVVNDPGHDQPVELYVVGDEEALKYINFPEKNVVLKPGEYRQMHFAVNFPSDMTPGRHNLRIGAVESLGAGGQIGGRVGVEMLVAIEVPTPGKYLVIDGFNLFDVKTGEPISPSVRITNRGKEIISTITAAFDILNVRDVRVATAVLSASALEPTKSTMLNPIIKTDGFLPGKYKAKLVIDYDGSRVSGEKQFNVGDLLINIIKVYAGSTKKDAIAKINLDYESLWNDPINNVVPAVKIYKGAELVGETVGQAFYANQFATGTAIVFFDTAGLEAGSYGIKATLSYENKTSTGEGTLNITSLASTMWAVAIITLALVVALLIRTRRRKR